MLKIIFIIKKYMYKYFFYLGILIDGKKFDFLKDRGKFFEFKIGMS